MKEHGGVVTATHVDAVSAQQGTATGVVRCRVGHVKNVDWGWPIGMTDNKGSQSDDPDTADGRDLSPRETRDTGVTRYAGFRERAEALLVRCREVAARYGTSEVGTGREPSDDPQQAHTQQSDKTKPR